MFSKLFKRKEKCIHEWKLYDYETGIDLTDTKYENYKLVCTKCSKTRITDSYEYHRMKDIGLIVDRNK